MKRVLIQDDDEDLFNVPLQPVLYHYYKENSKEIRRMVKQQCTGFWIQFVTSFRSFISNSDRVDGCQSYEEAFVDMLKMLTTENSLTGFISLIESVKRLHILLGSLRGYFMVSSHIMMAHAMSGFQKPLYTFPIYSRFAGSVVVLYQRWKHAPRIRARTPPAKWRPPAHWSQQNGHGPSLYECYLHDHWGDKLYRMIRIDKELMKFFQSDGGDSTSASSKNQNKMDNTNTTRQRRNRKRGHRRNRKGGAKEQRANQKEAMLQNEWEETDSPYAKEDRSSGIARDKNNAQIKQKSGSISQELKQKQEPGPSAATGEKTERTDTFRYDRLFKFDKANLHEESVGSNVKENEQEKDASFSAAEQSGNVNMTQKDPTFRYDKLFNFSTDEKSGGGSTAKNKQKEMEHISAEKKLPTDKDVTSIKTAKNCNLRYDRIFAFRNKECTAQTDSEVDANRDGECIKIKTEQKKGNIPSSKEKESTSYHSKTADSFRYERLFKFSKKKENVQDSGPDGNAELNANTKVGNSEKKGSMHYPKDKQFTTKTGTTSKTEENCFFRYDKLFNFSARKQNVPENTDKIYVAGENSDDSFGYDSETENKGPDDDIGFNRFYRGSSQHAYRKKNVSQPVRKFLMQKCSNCNILEKYPGMYKACKICIRDRVQAPKVYCGQHCRRTHWRKEHHAAH